MATSLQFSFKPLEIQNKLFVIQKRAYSGKWVKINVFFLMEMEQQTRMFLFHPFIALSFS